MAPTTEPVNDPVVSVGSEPDPDTLRYDESGERIFVPGLGWFAAGDFWALYDSDPARLPNDLDVGAVHVLRERWQEGGEADADRPEQDG